MRRLPFVFARRHGVLLAGHGVQARSGAGLNAVQEAQRFAGQTLALQWLSPETFEQALSDAYQHDSSAAMQMVEDLGSDMDLVSLADQVQETEDLLEQEDDAPIIRLINAILGEACQRAADMFVGQTQRVADHDLGDR